LSKDFKPGLRYVFTSKKYEKTCRRMGHEINSWAKDINGREVKMQLGDAWVGVYSVLPVWCKCIGKAGESWHVDEKPR